ncbi:hypothetical protein INT45_010069, partial [Circinella minor]
AKLDVGTKRVIDQEESVALLDQISEQDVQELYEQVSAELPPRQQQLIAPDYLQSLRIKFLDTRQQQEALASNGNEEKSVNSLISQQEQQQEPQSLNDLTMRDFEQLIYANALAKRPKEAEQALELMEKCGQAPTVRCYNHLMDAYANVNDVEKTIQVYKKIKEDEGLQPDIYSYSTLIKAFIESNQLEDAFIIFDKMKSSDMIPTQPIFSKMISGCIQANKVDRAWEVFDSMRLSYHQPDEVSFTLMLQACAKRGEVERALNLFEDMTGSYLYPTDVTFNVLINACAKRPDYFQAAFDLLEQMQTVYNFQPDLVTYNTLLSACARSGNLSRAHNIFNIIEEDADQHTFANLFSCYASYTPPRVSPTNTSVIQGQQQQQTEGLVERTLLSSQLPERRSAVVAEATKIFDSIVSDKRCDINTPLLTAYLSVHIFQKQSKEVMDIYLNMFEKYQVERIPKTFLLMLQHCYNQRDADFAWQVWSDYQEFLEQRQQQEKDISSAKRAIEGWSPDQQRRMALLMVNTLARGNDLKNALQLLATEFPNSKDKPQLNELKTLRNKCIQLEEDEALRKLERLVKRDYKPKPTDWRFKK